MMVTLTDEYPLPQGVVRLPIELCEQVIDYVAGYYDLDQSIKTLLACALTCRFWVPRVRRHLYRFAVVAKTKEQFASLLKRMETQPGFRDIRVLDVGYDRDPIQAHAQTWMSTVPDPLTRGLVHVRCLRLACVPPIVHRSFYVMLAHFRALTGVLLYGCHFERFTDFARLVLSFRTLSQLYLSKVDWPASSKARRGVRACKGMVRMPRLRLEILNMTLSAPYVVADAMNWLLHTSSGSTLHTVSIDFPAVEPQALVPNAAAQLIRACGPTLRSLRLRFDSVKDAAECAHILHALDLGQCKTLRQLSTRALPADRVVIDALTDLLKTLPSELSTLEDVLLWNHGREYFQGFPWIVLDQTLSDKSKHPQFKKFSVTVQQIQDAATLLPELHALGKLVLYETDSDHGEQFRFR